MLKYEQTRGNLNIDFARGADRRIVLCGELGIPRRKVFEIALRAIQKVSKDLGL